MDWLNEQSWYEELRGKWEELDPQSRLYLKVGGLAGTALFFLVFILGSVLSVRGLRNELREKTELLTLIESANDEMHRLRETNQALTSSTPGPWPAYFESIVSNSGFDKSAMTVGSEKSPAVTPTDTIKEATYELSLKHVSIKQVVRFAYGLENGSRPVKLKNLSIDTQADPTGYMDAQLSITAYAPIVSK